MSDKKQRINDARQAFYLASRALLDSMERCEPLDFSEVNKARAEYESARHSVDAFNCSNCGKRTVVDEQKDYGVIVLSFVGAPGAPEVNILKTPQRRPYCSTCYNTSSLTATIKEG